MTVTLKQRTYLNDDGKAVADTDPSRASLLGLEGDTIDNDVAKAAGIPTGALGKTKKATPSKNKQRTPAKNKAS